VGRLQVFLEINSKFFGFLRCLACCKLTLWQVPSSIERQFVNRACPSGELASARFGQRANLLQRGYMALQLKPILYYGHHGAHFA
jgi:hypothetical protein